jgi:hypothetical protein
MEILWVTFLVDYLSLDKIHISDLLVEEGESRSLSGEGGGGYLIGRKSWLRFVVR